MNVNPAMIDRGLIERSMDATPSRPVHRQSFVSALRLAGLSPPATREDEARQAAKGLIASAFLVPMLASMRENSLAAGPFAPTVAERRFGPLLDQQFADAVMKGTTLPLIDTIIDRYAKGRP